MNGYEDTIVFKNATDAQKLRVFSAILLLATRGGEIGKALAWGTVELEGGKVHTLTVSFVQSGTNSQNTNRSLKKVLEFQDTGTFLPDQTAFESSRDAQIGELDRLESLNSSSNWVPSSRAFPPLPGEGRIARKERFAKALAAERKRLGLIEQEFMSLYNAGETGAAIVLGHELGHALVGLNDPGLRPPAIRCGGNVTLIENSLRKEFGVPERKTYDGFPVPDEAGVAKSQSRLMTKFMAKYRANLTPARTQAIEQYLRDTIEALQAKTNNP